MLPLDDLLKFVELDIWAGETDIPIPMEGMTEREYTQHLRDTSKINNYTLIVRKEIKEDYSK